MDREDAFDREVKALEKYDGRKWQPQIAPASSRTYLEVAAYFREIARRAMTCAFRAEEAAQEAGESVSEPVRAHPMLEPE